jgi:Na+/H+-translocating membrane pyrophosphatase
MDPMLIVILLALIATVGAMFLGLLAMSSNEATDRMLSAPLMWARVGLQAVTIGLLFISLLLRHKS